MAKLPVITLKSHAIEIDYPRLFQGEDNEPRQEFLLRGFELEEVISVEIDQSRGLALVHMHPKHPSLFDVLERFASKLEENRLPAETFFPCPYFILQQQERRVIYARQPATARGSRRWAYMGLGVAFFGLSIIGVASPLVPTTPFVILSSYFASRSSPGFNKYLVRSRLFGTLLHDWHMLRAMRRSTKRSTLIFMCVMFLLTFTIVPIPPASLPVALAISLFSFGFILQLPTVEETDVEPKEPLLALAG
ncbi:YbaN family protein [Methylococcus sp. Mc7]|uniref:YbaN family protein n=1 Tax=Methylococcus sp. Mc7 TaxID=2860258 RepID=UPI001C528BFA|nr:YbaN family protein [Methylococcus sp. Mc7]QXP85724.1 YbaN family protein [Methylococcus sp. Mc7]